MAMIFNWQTGRKIVAPGASRGGDVVFQGTRLGASRHASFSSRNSRIRTCCRKIEIMGD